MAPQVFVVIFVSHGGLIDALDEFKLFCADNVSALFHRHVSSFYSQL